MKAHASVAFGILSVVSLLLTTAPAGLQLTPDSVSYLAAGWQLAAGQGLRDYNGQPFVLWPPVLPVLLAGISVLHIPVLRAIWILNAVVYGMTTALLVRHLSTTRDRLTLAVAAGLFVAVHPWFGYVHGHLWSESLFLLWTLLFLTNVRSLRWLTASAALACATRYIGISLIPVGLAVLLLEDGSLGRRIRRAALFFAGAVGPLAVWLWRNWSLTGTLVGPRATPVETLASAAAAVSQTLMAVAIPHRLALLPSAVGLVALVLVALYGLAQLRGGGDTIVGASLLWIEIYVAFLIAMSARSPVDEIGPRLVIPVVLAALVASPVVGPRYQWLAAASMAWVCAVSIYHFSYLWGQVRTDSATALRQTPTLDLPIPPGAELISNHPAKAFLALRRPVEASPRRTYYRSSELVRSAEVAALSRRVADRPTLLVWFHEPRPRAVPVDELSRTVSLVPLLDGPAVTVYEARPLPVRDPK